VKPIRDTSQLPTEHIRRIPMANPTDLIENATETAKNLVNENSEIIDTAQEQIKNTLGSTGETVSGAIDSVQDFLK